MLSDGDARAVRAALSALNDFPAVIGGEGAAVVPPGGAVALVLRAGDWVRNSVRAEGLTGPEVDQVGTSAAEVVRGVIAGGGSGFGVSYATAVERLGTATQQQLRDGFIRAFVTAFLERMVAPDLHPLCRSWAGPWAVERVNATASTPGADLVPYVEEALRVAHKHLESIPRTS